MRMKKLYLFTSFCLSITLLFGQNTFNKQYHFNWPLAIANSIYVTDSCYYFSGLIVDSIPPYKEGIVFGQLDLTGELTWNTSIFDSLNIFENWETPLLFNGEDFLSFGYSKDSLMSVYTMKINSDGEKGNTFYYHSPFVNEIDFFKPYSVFNKEYKYILACVGVNPEGINNEEIVILIINNNGTLISTNYYGDEWSDIPFSISSHENNIIIGSQRANFNLTRFDLEFYTKIIAVDTLGQQQWSWQSSNAVQQGANDMLATDDGGLVVVSGRGFLDQVNIETNRILWDRGLVFKLDSNQQVVWECEFTEPAPISQNKLSKIVKAQDDSGYVSAGKIVVWLSETNASQLGWLAKVSPQGDSLWSRKLFYYEYPDSLEYEHQIHDLQATPDGGYLMSGQTLDRNQLSTPIQQAWFIKVDGEGCLVPGCGLVDTKAPTEEGPPLLLYPNPASDYLNVYLGDGGGQNWSFVVYNSAGQQMGTYAAASSHTTYMIAVSNWPAGQYFLNVQNRKGQFLKAYSWVKQ